jgi:pimeloyl-ACP methyl ester carboxylesterase
MTLLGLANKTIRRVLVATGVQSEVRRIGQYEVHSYRVDGAGSTTPVVLVHGLGSSANSYGRTLRLLSKRFRRVFALDIPGNGFSPLPPNGPLPLNAQMETVEQFIDDVVGEPVFLVGNSLGGAMSARLAVRHPTKVKALALVSPAGAKVATARIEALIRSFDVTTNAQARAMTRRLFHRPPLPLLLFAGEMKRLYATPTVRSIVTEVKASDALQEKELAALTMPTLLLWGRSEKLLPYEGVDYFRTNLPRTAEIHEVPGFGHIPQMEQPGEVVARLLKFANKHHL